MGRWVLGRGLGQVLKGECQQGGSNSFVEEEGEEGAEEGGALYFWEDLEGVVELGKQPAESLVPLLGS